MINRLRKGDVTGAILNRFGLVGGAFYWIVVSLVMAGMFLDVSRVTLQVGGVIACLPLLVLFFGQPLRDLFIDREEGHEEESGSPWIDGFLEMWEALLTYVTNTLSFLRVAAFALIHAALSYSVYVLMELVGQLPAGLVWKSLVFVIGTVLIIGLEGLVVGIQIFRLEYYEFFTKFFRASGRKFSPFRLTGTAPSS
jgi:V/A-type H+-transporting ATPase subunit I